MTQTTGAGQFRLLKTRRFLPFFLTQFLGALNDNLYKNALLVILVSAGAAGMVGDVDVAVNLAAGLFILPFFLLSPIAGQFADKYEKSGIIRYLKRLEILIMALGFVAFWFQHYGLLVGVLFAMGAQSAFFGPVKYAIIPQHLAPTELVGGNAQVEMGTFAAILLGTLFGSLIGGLGSPVFAGSVVVAMAVLGWLSSRFIPVAQPYAPQLDIDWNPLRQSWRLLRLAGQDPMILLAILGISWFWMLGATYLTQVPNFAVSVLGGEASLIAMLLCAFTVGISLGSLLCERLGGRRVEIGLVPLGALGLSLAGVDLYFAGVAYPVGVTVGPGDFIQQLAGLRILADLVLIGTFGGFYIVPLYALIQSRTPSAILARIIACNNILNALFMVVASLLGMLLLGAAGLSIPELYLLMALLNAAVTLIIFWRRPEFTARFLVWCRGQTRL